MGTSAAVPAIKTSANAARVWLWSGIAVLLLGVLLTAVSITRMFASIGLGDAFSSPVVQAPVTLVEFYEPETYFVYQAIDGAERISPSQIEVRGVDGELPVVTPRYQASIDDGDLSMEAVAAFTVTRAGEYSVSLAPGEPTLVRVGPALGAGIGPAVAWGFGIGSGVLLSLVGVTLLAVGLVRRASNSAAEHPQPAHTTRVTASAASGQALPPPGWYPDPIAANSQRYWDGRSWTEHHT